MSENTTTSTLTLDEINLMKNSEELKDADLYGNLYEVISTQSFNRGLQISQIKGLDVKAQRVLHYNKQLMMKNIISEWYAEKAIETDEQKKIRCGLCNTRNKYLFFIRNRKNDIVLNVGSSCITKFPGIEGYQEQKIALGNIQKNKIVAKRTLEFNEFFPDVIQYINKKESEFNNLPILIPREKYELIKKLIKELRLIYVEYTQKGKCKEYEKPFEIFSLKKIALDNAMIFAQNYVTENISHPLICKKSEINWMIKTNRISLLLKIAENDGYYTKNTLKFVFSPNLLKSHLKCITDRNISSILKLTKYNEKTNEFIFETQQIYYPPVRMSINGTKLMENIGANCILDEKYTYETKEIMSNGKVIPDKGNLYSILKTVEGFVEKYGCVFLDDEESNHFYLYREFDASVRVLDKTQFLISYTPYICQSLDKMERYFKNMILDKKSKWLSRYEQDKYGIFENIKKLYKSYGKM